MLRKELLQFGEFFGDWGFDGSFLHGLGMAKDQAAGVQKKAAELGGEGFVFSEVAVFVVADDGKVCEFGVGEVGAELVGASGFDLRADEGGAVPLADEFGAGFGGFSFFGVVDDLAVAVRRGDAAQGGGDAGGGFLPLAEAGDEIFLFHLIFAPLAVEFAQGGGSFRQDQNTGGALVQAVGELQILFGAGGAQAFYDSERDSAAAVDGESGGFVDYQEPVVLHQDGRGGKAASRRDIRADGGGRTRRVGGRESDVVVPADAGEGFGAFSVDADLSGADEAVDDVAGQRAKNADEEVIQPLSVVIGRDNLDFCLGIGGHFKLTRGAGRRAHSSSRVIVSGAETPSNSSPRAATSPAAASSAARAVRAGSGADSAGTLV